MTATLDHGSPTRRRVGDDAVFVTWDMALDHACRLYWNNRRGGCQLIVTTPDGRRANEAREDQFRARRAQTAERPCAQCGEKFMPRMVDGKSTVNCSDACRHRANADRLRALNAAKKGKRSARCARGLHDFTPENTVVKKDGGRACRACLNARKRELRAERKEAS